MIETKSNIKRINPLIILVVKIKTNSIKIEIYQFREEFHGK